MLIGTNVTPACDTAVFCTALPKTYVTAIIPSPHRSGHRMIVWRGFLVLFGGFYEAMREVRRMLYSY
jgi:hypothetical protein